MARQQRVDWGDGEGDPQLNNGEYHVEKDDWWRMSQDNGFVEEANHGRLCPSNGVENGMDNGCAEGHLLVRSSENGNAIEEDLLEEEEVDGSFKGGGGDEEGRMSRLEVPRSLYSSNILGLSQETDSDAESIR